MNYKSLSSAEMIQVTGDWVTPKKKGYAALSQNPATAGLLPFIVGAHDELVAAEVTGDSARAKEIKALSARGIELDRQHDAYVRCVVGVLAGLAEVASTPELAESYRNASLAYFPAQFGAAQASYKEESGQAKLAPKRATEADVATVESISTPDGTLKDYLDRWMKISKELGEVDAARSRLEATETDKRGTNVVAARNAWIAAVSRMVDVLDLVKLDDETRATVLGPLENETAKASRATGKTEATEPVVTPVVKPTA